MPDFIFISSPAEITLPDYRCPICKANVVIDEIYEWEEDENGQWKAHTVKINCETEPGIDEDEWDDWHNGHWSMPYVDWLPLEQCVTQWVNARYRWNLK